MKYSMSRVKKLNACSRQFYLHYVEGWRERKEKPWLTYGKAIDDLLAIYDVNGFDAMMSEISKYFTDEYTNIDVTYLLKHYHEKFGKEILKPIEIEGVPGNQWYWKTRLSVDYADCEIEVEGYLDKVSDYNGYPCVVERKTTKDPIEFNSAYWAPLKQDKQIICYSYLLSEASGTPANRVFYEVLRKPSKTVSPLFSRTHTVKKETVNYSLKEYEERVKTFFNAPKKTMVARKKLWITETMIDEWKADIIGNDDGLMNMKTNEKKYKSLGMNPILAYPRNQASCDAYGGCAFKKFCDGIDNIEDIELIYKKED